ncbi:MAG TPA: LPS export ABC transporter periplasmic protein LptC [Patescibacteria group bacterium]|nr:LPS export ABC transporter periplasmic protein LptC [Patescibacteria group bacterium]
MMYRRIFLCVSFLFSCAGAGFAEKAVPLESDQQISDFSLAGYGEKGKKSWDLAGKTADIFSDVVKLKDIVGNFYAENDTIRLVADKGDFNKADGKVHLQQNVVVTTSSGTKMSTDALDWDRKKNMVMTDELVNIEKANMVSVAQGAQGEPNLNKVTLLKDVQVNFNPEAKTPEENGLKNKIVITCDGPLEVDYAKNVAVFKNNVKVVNQDSEIYSDQMDVYFNKGAKNKDAAQQNNDLVATKVDRIVARGNVKIVRGENISYSEEAVYTSGDRKITLSGKPKLVIYSTEGLHASP